MSSKPALWGTVITSLGVTIGSLGSFDFRMTYGAFLNRHFQIYQTLYVTPHAMLHVLSFALLSFLAYLISERTLARSAGIAAILILSVVIELLQLRSHPNNPFEFWDVRSDTVGVGIGLLLAGTWSAFRSRPSEMYTQ